MAADLERSGVGCFLPLMRTRRRYGGQTIYISLPLFPGYLFLCGGEEERYVALMTHRVARIIRVLDQERLRYELRQIHTLTSSREPADLYPGIRQGRRVRVTRGSLEGLEGTVVRRRDVCRVYVGVDVLGQSAELEIDSALLEVIE